MTRWASGSTCKITGARATRYTGAYPSPTAAASLCEAAKRVGGTP